MSSILFWFFGVPSPLNRNLNGIALKTLDCTLQHCTGLHWIALEQEADCSADSAECGGSRDFKCLLEIQLHTPVQNATKHAYHPYSPAARFHMNLGTHAPLNSMSCIVRIMTPKRGPKSCFAFGISNTSWRILFPDQNWLNFLKMGRTTFYEFWESLGQESRVVEWY